MACIHIILGVYSAPRKESIDFEGPNTDFVVQPSTASPHSRCPFETIYIGQQAHSGGIIKSHKSHP